MSKFEISGVFIRFPRYECTIGTCFGGNWFDATLFHTKNTVDKQHSFVCVFSVIISSHFFPFVSNLLL